MSLYITSLNSGSNGNCYYVGNEHEAVLIDAGISCRETETRMKRLALSMQKVKAIFISHEHSDHIRGVEVLAKKYSIPVYITPLTLQHGRLMLHESLVRPLSDQQNITIGTITVTTFKKLHDAAEPHSFMISCNGINVGVLTDIGAVCDNVIHHFRQCHAAFLEANYDEDMLAGGRYPYHLKRRISGGYGHLSNTQALALFIDHKPDMMSHLLLAHLSKDNNNPDLVYNLFNTHARGTNVIVASRFKETGVYYIGKDVNNHLHKQISQKQFSLF